MKVQLILLVVVALLSSFAVAADDAVTPRPESFIHNAAMPDEALDRASMESDASRDGSHAEADALLAVEAFFAVDFPVVQAQAAGSCSPLVLTCGSDATCSSKCLSNGCATFRPQCFIGRCFCDLR